VIEGQGFCHDCKVLREALDDPNKVIYQCGKCSKPIYGEFIMLQGKHIHPEHFACFECGAALKGGQCFEFDNNLYCKYDYEKLMAACCGGCKKKIDGRGTTALGRQWHPECFCCCVCEKEFTVGDYYENEGKAYCKEHYFAQFGELCKGCNKPIMVKALKAIGAQWHPECFKCSGCDKPLAGQPFNEVDEKPVCKKCFGLLPPSTRKAAEKVREARLQQEKAEAKAAEAAAKAAVRTTVKKP
jgi:hypothetical protein